jgi:cation:H+ antiporter
MAIGAVLIVEGVQAVSGVESTQTKVGLTLVGFATGFELVVLAWSSARRGITEAVVAAVVGSFAYNATMTLGAGALARPLAIRDASSLHLPWIAMILALVAVVAASIGGRIGRWRGVALLLAYPAYVGVVLAFG